MEDLNNILESQKAKLTENPFKAPDGYFESFASRLNEKIESEKTEDTQETNKKTKLLTFIKPALAVASIIIFGWVAWSVLFSVINTQIEVADNNDGYTDAIELYLYDSDSDYYDETFYAETEETTDDLSSEEIMDYLAYEVDGLNTY